MQYLVFLFVFLFSFASASLASRLDSCSTTLENTEIEVLEFIAHQLQTDPSGPIELLVPSQAESIYSSSFDRRERFENAMNRLGYDLVSSQRRGGVRWNRLSGPAALFARSVELGHFEKLQFGSPEENPMNVKVKRDGSIYQAASGWSAIFGFSRAIDELGRNGSYTGRVHISHPFQMNQTNLADWVLEVNARGMFLEQLFAQVPQQALNLESVRTRVYNFNNGKSLKQTMAENFAFQVQHRGMGLSDHDVRQRELKHLALVRSISALFDTLGSDRSLRYVSVSGSFLDIDGDGLPNHAELFLLYDSASGRSAAFFIRQGRNWEKGLVGSSPKK